MSILLRKGDLVADYSFARPSLAALKAAGFKAIVRYLSPQPNTKNVTAAELQECERLGLGVIFVWEINGTRVVVSGAAGGRSDVAEAVRQARALPGGYVYPAGQTIIFANDTDNKASDLPNVYGYFDSVIAGKAEYKAGAYTEFEIVEALRYAGYDLFMWQPAAWSGTYVRMTTNGNTWFQPMPQNISTAAAALQIVGSSLDTSSFGGLTDENHWLLPFNAWVPGQPDTPYTDDMAYLIITVAGTKAVFIGASAISEVTGTLIVPEMEWVNGSDANELARYTALSKHMKTIQIAVADCLNISVDRVPTGDSGRSWVAADFGHVKIQTPLAPPSVPVDVQAIVNKVIPAATAGAVAAVQGQITALAARIPTKAVTVLS